MSTQLTHDQKQALHWIIDAVRDGRLTDPFTIYWIFDRPMGSLTIPDRPAIDYPDEITESNLSALVAAGRLSAKRFPLWAEYSLYPDLQSDSAPEQPPSRATPAAPPPDDHAHKARLARFIDDYFDKEGLENLCFDLGIDYHNLPGEKKETKARRLITHVTQLGRLPELEHKLAAERPESYRAAFGRER